MADVFLSYSSADRSRASALGSVLRDEGWSVFWDRDIATGQDYDEVIEHELDDAKCVVVLWSRDSVRSGWVRAEASEGARRKVLCPVTLDLVRVPLEFRRLQTASLAGWDCVSHHPELERIARDVSRILHSSPYPADRARMQDEDAGSAGSRAPAESGVTRRSRLSSSATRRRVVVGGGLLAAIPSTAATLLVWTHYALGPLAAPVVTPGAKLRNWGWSAAPTVAALLLIAVGIGAVLDRLTVLSGKRRMYDAVLQFWVRLDEAKISDLSRFPAWVLVERLSRARKVGAGVPGAE